MEVSSNSINTSNELALKSARHPNPSFTPKPKSKPHPTPEDKHKHKHKPKPNSKLDPSKPSTSTPSLSTSTSRPKRTKLRPTLPPPPKTSSHPTSSLHPSHAAPSLPIKTLQGRGSKRTDTTHPGFGRDVIFVTRKTGLGMLIGRCRGLVVDEGYSKLTFHAMGAAIPQALLLLHAVLDILPYPLGKRGMWYEIRTASVECVDEVSHGDDEAGEGVEFGDLGAVEEDVPDRVVRMKSSIQIDLNISPRPDPSSSSTSSAKSIQPVESTEKRSKRNRPSKERRNKLRQRMLKESAKQAHTMEIDEEEMLNDVVVGRKAMESVVIGHNKSEDKAVASVVVGHNESDEEEEEIEMR
ncbi:hypothetical protein BCR39DRAFT_531515 [Naematelia encephala]|uniref:Uncharacterized protein n=1 Tax=Naematelia encephala TaxID=71784 RepID=A0A1Y2B4K8_9TREE|nr:hypothetical protein BCR39DRAFT_531515 [Naematelia encephala]